MKFFYWIESDSLYHKNECPTLYANSVKNRELLARISKNDSYEYEVVAYSQLHDDFTIIRAQKTSLTEAIQFVEDYLSNHGFKPIANKLKTFI